MLQQSEENKIYMNKYLAAYNDNDRLEWCKIALKKYKFENYKLGDNNINPHDYIITDSDFRDYIIQIVNKEKCSIDEFKHIFSQLSIDNINYIGF